MVQFINQNVIMKKNIKFQNTEYNLLGKKIKIEFVDTVEDDDGRWIYGCCEQIADTAIIRISLKDSKGNKLSTQSIIRTIRHELYHAICDKGQYFTISADEPFIEWLALCTDILHEQGAII